MEPALAALRAWPTVRLGTVATSTDLAAFQRTDFVTPAPLRSTSTSPPITLRPLKVRS